MNHATCEVPLLIYCAISSVSYVTKVCGRSEDMYVKVCNAQGSAAVSSSQFQGPIRGRDKAEPRPNSLHGPQPVNFQAILTVSEKPATDQ